MGTDRQDPAGRWGRGPFQVKADFPSASAACAMVVKSSKPRGVAREAR